MNFLNVSLALGAAAVLVPLIIHIFNRSRFKVVNWGAMHLLEAVIRVSRKLSLIHISEPTRPY